MEASYQTSGKLDSLIGFVWQHCCANVIKSSYAWPTESTFGFKGAITITPSSTIEVSTPQHKDVHGLVLKFFIVSTVLLLT